MGISAQTLEKELDSKESAKKTKQSPESHIDVPISRDELRAEMNQEGNIILHRSPLDKVPRMVLFVLTCIFMVYVSREFPVTVQHLNLGEWFNYKISIGIPLLGLIPIIVLVRIAHDLLNYRYILTPEYILEIEGFLDLKIRTTRLYYINIRGVELDKNIYQRFFNLADLRIGTDVLTPHTDIAMKGIYNPRFYKNIIQQKRREYIDSLKGSKSLEEILDHQIW